MIRNVKHPKLTTAFRGERQRTELGETVSFINMLFVTLAAQGHSWKQGLSPACSQQLLFSAL